MGNRTKIKVTILGRKFNYLLNVVDIETATFGSTSPTSLKNYVREHNKTGLGKGKNHISQKDIETFIKFLEDNKLVTVERK